MLVVRFLHLAAEDLNAIEPIGCGFAHEDRLLLARLFVHADYGVQPPVGYVHPLLVYGNGEGMANQSGIDVAHVCAVEVRVLHMVQQSVAPRIYPNRLIHGFLKAR